MDTAEEDVLAYMSFPPQHRTKLHSTNPLERLNGEIERRIGVIGIFPNEDAVSRLVGALLFEQNDEWAVQRGRYMTLESVAQLSDDPAVTLPAMTMFTGLLPAGRISLDRRNNIFGGAAPFYRCYLCKDGREMSVGPLEPKFFTEMLAKLGLETHPNDRMRSQLPCSVRF